MSAITLLILAMLDSVVMTIHMAIKRWRGRGTEKTERPADKAARKRRDEELNAIAQRQSDSAT